MSVTLEQFRKEGWKLTEEGLDLLKEWSEVDDPTFDQCLAVALNSDLKQFCKGDIGKEMPSTISPPHILQLQEVVNIAVPLQHQVDHPRMLRAIFTDGGKKKIKGVEMHGKVDGLKLNTPPGTKFVVTKNITVDEDLLMLGPGVLKNIGGYVESMVNEWKASKQFIMRSNKAKKDTENNENDDGPPPFVPYKIPTTIDKPHGQQPKAIDKPHQKATKKDADKENAAPPSANETAKAKTKGGKGSEKANGKDKKKPTAAETKERNKDTVASIQKKKDRDPSEGKAMERNVAKSAKGSKKEAGPSKQVQRPKATKSNKVDAKVEGADASSAQELRDTESNKAPKEVKAPKPKRPEQTYYMPKPRITSEGAPSSSDNSHDSLSMGLSIDGARRMNIPKQAASAGTEKSANNDIIGDSGARQRSRGHGRGRGRDHSRGRGRGRGGGEPAQPSQ